MKSPLRRLVPLAVLILAFAIGMATLLNSFKFEATLERLQRSRLSAVSSDVADAARNSVALGLELEQMPTLNELVSRLSRADPLILGIDVFASDGRILYSSEAQRRGSAASSHWVGAAQHPAAREFFLREPADFVVGTPIRNSFDVVLGAVAVRYDRAPRDRSVALMNRALLTDAAITFIVAAGLAVLGLLWLFARLQKDVEAADIAQAERCASEVAALLDR